MCQDLVIEVVAEGVETHEQEAILRDLECKLGQGYLYGKPMPASEFERAYL
ncbi:EAL domain-containing protein [Gordonibacter sp.]